MLERGSDRVWTSSNESKRIVRLRWRFRESDPLAKFCDFGTIIDGRIGGAGEEVTWGGSGTGDRVEREGIDGSGMSDEFASLRCRRMIHFLKIDSFARVKVSPLYREEAKKEDS